MTHLKIGEAVAEFITYTTPNIMFETSSLSPGLDAAIPVIDKPPNYGLIRTATMTGNVDIINDME
jgi:hypothetical protein